MTHFLLPSQGKSNHQFQEGSVTELDLPPTFPLTQRSDLLLDVDRIAEALENCDRYGHSLEVRTPAVK